MSSHNSNEHLPAEILNYIYDNVGGEDLAAAARVSRFWHDNVIFTLYSREELEVTSKGFMMALARTPLVRRLIREGYAQRIKFDAFQFKYALNNDPLGDWMLIQVLRGMNFPNVRAICLKTRWHLDPEQPGDISDFKRVEHQALACIVPRTTEFILADEVSIHSSIPRHSQFLRFPTNNITSLKMVTQGSYHMANEAPKGLPKLRSFSWAVNTLATLDKDVDCGLWSMLDRLSEFEELDLVDISGIFGTLPEDDFKFIKAKVVRLSDVMGILVNPVLESFDMSVMEELQIEPNYDSTNLDVELDPLTEAITDGESSLRKLTIEQFFDDWATDLDPAKLDKQTLIGIARGNPSLRSVKIGSPYDRFETHGIDDDAIGLVARALPDLEEFVLHAEQIPGEHATSKSIQELKDHCSQLKRVVITQVRGDWVLSCAKPAHRDDDNRQVNANNFEMLLDHGADPMNL